MSVIVTKHTDDRTSESIVSIADAVINDYESIEANGREFTPYHGGASSHVVFINADYTPAGALNTYENDIQTLRNLRWFIIFHKSKTVFPVRVVVRQNKGKCALSFYYHDGNSSKPILLCSHSIRIRGYVENAISDVAKPSTAPMYFGSICVVSNEDTVLSTDMAARMVANGTKTLVSCKDVPSDMYGLLASADIAIYESVSDDVIERIMNAMKALCDNVEDMIVDSGRLT